MNPDFQPAELVSSRWTMTPRIQWTAGESNPDYLGANQASFRWTSSPRIFVNLASGATLPSLSLLVSSFRSPK